LTDQSSSGGVSPTYCTVLFDGSSCVLLLECSRTLVRWLMTLHVAAHAARSSLFHARMYSESMSRHQASAIGELTYTLVTLSPPRLLLRQRTVSVGTSIQTRIVEADTGKEGWIVCAPGYTRTDHGSLKVD